ncbi:exonuclease domain-containing protein [Rhodococcoides fascians]|uniref:exonuclease domain-containing protein n=1 Tax=Rhodococcoides fascians TaxID=1828 RepID=UPI0006925A6F|nr:exonuclease domain-containing protein [Rhodococcus fascians]
MSNETVSQSISDPSWFDLPLAFFDVESTGKDPKKAKLVTACVGRIDGSDVVVKKWLANPGTWIPDEAVAIHGITNEHARARGRPHDEVCSEIAAELQAVWREGRIIAGYNLVYDLTLLQSRVGDLLFAVDGPVVDGFIIDREFDKYRKGSRKLVDTCKYYGIEVGAAHEAEADALASARLVWKLAHRFPQLQELTADQLMIEQAVWHRDRQLGFIEYLKRTKKPFDDVNVDWPVAS